nr:unnamed protein product [Callosobruchus chinensis]
MFLKFSVLCLIFNCVYCISHHPILIIVSYDAFKYNFFDTKLVPHMETLKKQGTYADYLLNVFPTKTFPNHHSIATGLYPETHGVLGNSYYDPKTKRVEHISQQMFHYSDNVVPIWRFNEDQGNGRYSGSMMWPGAYYAYQGKNITYRQDFDEKMDWNKRVDMVISWITDRKKPANLVMLYIEQPDTYGHIFGANAPQFKEMLRKLDNVTKYLQDQLESHHIADKVNVVHLSDHGLVTITPQTFINITQYMKEGTYTWAGATPCIQITPHKGHEEEIYTALKDASIKNGHFKVYKKQDFPKQWHYKNNLRSPPILVMADVGWGLDDMIEASQKYAKLFNFTLTNSSEFGVHGYDTTVADMHPYFMARGPKIKKQHKVSPFHTVDLFNLFTELLELPQMANNGTLGNIVDILNDNKQGRYNVGSVVMVTVGGIVAGLFIIALITVIVLLIIKHQQNLTTVAALNKRFPQTFQNHIESQHLLDAEYA